MLKDHGDVRTGQEPTHAVTHIALLHPACRISIMRPMDKGAGTFDQFATPQRHSHACSRDVELAIVGNLGNYLYSTLGIPAGLPRASFWVSDWFAASIFFQADLQRPAASEKTPKCSSEAPAGPE